MILSSIAPFAAQQAVVRAAAMSDGALEFATARCVAWLGREQQAAGLHKAARELGPGGHGRARLVRDVISSELPADVVAAAGGAVIGQNNAVLTPSLLVALVGVARARCAAVEAAATDAAPPTMAALTALKQPPAVEAAADEAVPTAEAAAANGSGAREQMKERDAAWRCVGRLGELRLELAAARAELAEAEARLDEARAAAARSNAYIQRFLDPPSTEEPPLR